VDLIKNPPIILKQEDLTALLDALDRTVAAASDAVRIVRIVSALHEQQRAANIKKWLTPPASAGAGDAR
jgi:hypothetical protein